MSEKSSFEDGVDLEHMTCLDMDGSSFRFLLVDGGREGMLEAVSIGVLDWESDDGI